MTRSNWVLVLSLTLMTGVAAYEFAYIQRLITIIQMLLSGSPN